MGQVLRDGGSPHLFTFTSSAVRLCQAALAAGLNLRGAHFTVVGEPLTEARLAAIRKSGGEAVPRYAIIECSSVGHGCLAPETADEGHLLHDLHAVIQPEDPGAVAGMPGTALLLSSLRRTAPYILVNVSMGDRAEMLRRACGCPLDGLGWGIHLRTIRSHEKLTAEGMTFLDVDLIRVLEAVLPARFGGAPTDYQLVEGEEEGGQPRLRLLIHPAVGPVDEEAVREAFLTAISAGSGVERVMGQVWRDAGLLRVERRAPYTTTSGKILHLHVDRAAAPCTAFTESRPMAPGEMDEDGPEALD